MNSYVTGTVIRQLREKKGLTQAALAERIHVSAKTVSKWETGRGYPDISLLEPVAEAFGVSVAELLSGRAVSNRNVSANMLRSRIYVCPVCGNVIQAMGEAAVSCHGIQLAPCEEEPSNEDHKIFLERSGDEYYTRIDHEMTKKHYISFIAGVSDDRMEMVRLYPEGNAEARVRIRGVRKILFYCNRDGLFRIDPVKGIDDRERCYEDIEERRELEKAAALLFG